MKPVRVLIVDDSATMRRILTAVLANDPEIEVVGSAPEPAVARQMIKELNPDVLTLDVEMPKMDGVAFIGELRKHNPNVSVILISGFTDALGVDEKNTGADIVIQKSNNEVAHLVRAVNRLLRNPPAARKKPASSIPPKATRKSAGSH